jgi:predicted lipid-binding transport protein (Tim44 family)
MHAALRWFALAVLASCVGLAPDAWARGGGGCLAAGTRIATPTGAVAVEQLRIGEAVLSRDANGQPVTAVVRAVYAVQPEEYFELHAGGHVLCVTAEHPVQTAPGTWMRADHLAASTALGTAEGPVTLDGVVRHPAAGFAYNLLVSPGGTFFANGVLVHNKGCFLPDTPITLADGSTRSISDVRPGDTVLAFDSDEALVPATVRDVLVHDVASYLVVRTDTRELHVTEEHPFYVGGGVFKTAEALRVGERIVVYDGRGLAPETLRAIERVAAPVRVYNLQTVEPHTFFASGVAVHNKGGGCFAAGTRVLTPEGSRAIETLRLGDVVLAVAPDGRSLPAAVRGIYLNFTPLLTLHTDRGTLRTTEEHPLALDAGGFAFAGTLALGARLAIWDETGCATVAVRQIERGAAPVAVYNLSVDTPHTFVADGFIAHNKGGGGFHGGSSGFHGSSGGSGGSGDPTVILIVLGVIVVIVVLSKIRENTDGEGEELDYCFSRGQIDGKLAKTRKLLAFISRVDDAWTESSLQEHAKKVFAQLQECWQAREYAPMEPLLMPDLYAEHVAQLQGMRQTHEINRIEQLAVEAVDIVHVNYTEKVDHRAFTALITASALDYYVDDRDQSFLRGDDTTARFQEFWTFHWYNGGWRLREIEQSRESNVLAEENFFEQFTDVGLAQIYDQTAGETGPIGPQRGAALDAKAQRIERLLNFLVQTDRAWDREAMLGTVRRVYLNVLLAWQDGRPEAFAGLDLAPELAQHLRNVNVANQGTACRVEYRNLCVRKVELVHINNRDDRRLDEFTALVSAHAQIVVTRAGRVEYRDPDVRTIQDYWTFGRGDARWVLREILPAADGASLLHQENVDEGSSPEMLAWFYSKPRAT